MKASSSDQLIVIQISQNTWPPGFDIGSYSQVRFQGLSSYRVTVTLGEVSGFVPFAGTNPGNAPVFEYSGDPNKCFSIVAGKSGDSNSTMITIDPGTP